MIPCFVCDRPLEEEPDDVALARWRTPPYGDSIGILHGGLFFRATGNYGSMFDPIMGEILEVAICDDCVRARAGKTTHLTTDASGKTIIARGPFVN